MARDVMLFAGGVSYFGLLAVFPAIAVAVSLYGLVATPEQAQQQASLLAFLLPPGAKDLVVGQLAQLQASSFQILSIQGLAAFLIAVYGATRGMKALMAGLNRISEDEDFRGVLHFNLFAAGVTLLAILGALAASAFMLAVPVVLKALPVDLEAGERVLRSEWIWAGLSMAGAFALLYRFAMARSRIPWRAALFGSCVATGLCLGASRGVTVYVTEIADFGATYGSIGAVVALLLWIYFMSYAVFFGGALAAETADPRALRFQT